MTTHPDYDYTWPDGTPATDADLDRRFAAALDDAYADPVICGHAYGPARALLAVDPIAYTVDRNQWVDDLIRDGALLEQ